MSSEGHETSRRARQKPSRRSFCFRTEDHTPNGGRPRGRREGHHDACGASPGVSSGQRLIFDSARVTRAARPRLRGWSGAFLGTALNSLILYRLSVRHSSHTKAIAFCSNIAAGNRQQAGSPSAGSRPGALRGGAERRATVLSTAKLWWAPRRGVQTSRQTSLQWLNALAAR